MLTNHGYLMLKAMEGLTLRTVRPSFTVLQSVTAVPRSPLVRIEFGADGVPVTAEILEASSAKWFDDAVRSSLYRWRATGKRLESMEEGDIAVVELRIVVRPR